MANEFQPILPDPQPQGSVFAQPPITPVNNSTANAINAFSGLVQIGGEAYKQFQNNQELKGVASEFTKNLAAVQQGTLKPADAEIKNSAFMSAALVRRPDLAPQIKDMAVTVLGNSPTEEINKQLNHDRLEAQKMSDITLNDQVTTAAKAGMPILDENGKLDVTATAKVGNRLNAIHYKAEQDRLAHAALPSQAERNAADEKALMSVAEQLYKDNLGSSLSQFGTLYDQAQGKPKQDQLNILGGAVQAHSLIFNQALMAAADKLGAGAEVRTKVLDYYAKPTEQLMKVATGDLSDAANTARNLKSIQDHYAIPVAMSTPLATGMSTNFGGAAAAIVVQKPIQQLQPELAKESTGVQDAVNTPSMVKLGDPNIQDLENKYNVLTGAKDYTSLTKEEQPTVLNTAVQVGQATEKGFGLLTPKQQENYAHTVTTISSAMNEVTTPDNAKQYADYFNRQSFIDTFDKLAKRNIAGSAVDKVAKERVDYTTKTIESLVKAGGVQYDPKADKTNNLVINSLVGNLNTFGKYINDYNVQAEKEKLFKSVSVNPPSTAQGN